MAKTQPDTRNINVDEVISGVASSLKKEAQKLTQQLVKNAELGSREKFNIEHFGANIEDRLEQYASRRVHQDIALNDSVDLEAYKAETKTARENAQWYLESEHTMNAGKVATKEFMKKMDAIIDKALEPYQSNARGK